MHRARQRTAARRGASVVCASCAAAHDGFFCHESRICAIPYGSQRRLEIARILAADPKLILLDEPAAGMNPQESAELVQMIRHVQETYHLTVLLIEHDMKVIMNLCSYIYAMAQGEVIAEGTPEQIRSDPKVITAYLGRRAHV